MTMKKAKIAVLVSGGGTNLQALLDAQAAGLLPHGEIALVVSSNEGAYALDPGGQRRRSCPRRSPPSAAAVRRPLSPPCPTCWRRMRSTSSFWPASSPSSVRTLPPAGPPAS